MTEKDFDPFAGSDGLLDDFDVEIQEVTFEVNLSLDDTGEKLFAHVTGRTDDDDQPEFDEYFGLGTGWETTDGRTVGRADGRRKGFNKSTKYQLWIAGAVDAGAGDVLRKRDPELGPMNAAIWEGLTFHVNRKEHDYGGDIGKKGILVPTEFKGEAKGKAAAKAEAPTTASGNGVSAALKAKLKKIAKASESLDEFIDQAFAVDGVDGNAEAEELVVSGSLYEEVQAAA